MYSSEKTFYSTSLLWFDSQSVLTSWMQRIEFSLGLHSSVWIQIWGPPASPEEADVLRLGPRGQRGRSEKRLHHVFSKSDSFPSQSSFPHICFGAIARRASPRPSTSPSEETGGSSSSKSFLPRPPPSEPSLTDPGERRRSSWRSRQR